MEASLILSILAIAGVGLTYWFLQQKIEKQKQRFRKRLEELEDRQESRILEVMESAQVNYQVQLKQATEELQQQFEARLQETLKSLPENSPTQLSQNTEELKQEYEAQQPEAIQPLEERDNDQIQQITPLFDKATEDSIIESEANSELQQKVIEPLRSEVQPTPLEITSLSTSSANSELEQEIRDPWSEGNEETQPEPLKNSFVSTSEAVAEQEQEIVAPWSEEIQPTLVENSFVSLLETNPELEEEIRAQSNQEIEQEIQQAIKEIISVITYPADSNVTAPSLNDTANRRAQGVAEKIIAMGQSRQVAYIPKLTEYIHHPNTRIRGLVVSALGTIAASQPQKAEVQRVIPLLGKLSRSSEPSVRQSAVEALANIKSEAVIPFLKLALRDSDRNVVKAASFALSKFKFYPMSQGTKISKVSSKALKR
ncbi:HEAT repeat domain-containing protein [Allocoleopsis sp.]|uniref:HEAT repeat domain-containing protein n=1 Tax=Allocoleopsis sp. TaxID=3088169 RepID=UPI002FCE7EAE